MKFKLFKAALASVILSVSGLANAGLITVSETQYQWVDFEDFTFTFNIDDWLLNNSSTLRVSVLGDFDSPGVENLNVLAESHNFGTINYLTSGTTVLQQQQNYIEFYFDLTLSAVMTNELLADDSATFEVNFSEQVHEFNIHYTNIGAAYAKIDFTYEQSTDVPEPSTLAIFALGMIGLASRRFKKQS